MQKVLVIYEVKYICYSDYNGTDILEVALLPENLPEDREEKFCKNYVDSNYKTVSTGSTSNYISWSIHELVKTSITSVLVLARD